MKNLNIYLLSYLFLCFVSVAHADPEEFAPVATITSKGIRYSDPAYKSNLNDILTIYQKDLHKYGQRPLVDPKLGPAPGADVTLVLIDFGVEEDGTVDCFIVESDNKTRIRMVGGRGRPARIRLDRWIEGKTGWELKESI